MRRALLGITASRRLCFVQPLAGLRVAVVLPAHPCAQLGAPTCSHQHEASFQPVGALSGAGHNCFAFFGAFSAGSPLVGAPAAINEAPASRAPRANSPPARLGSLNPVRCALTIRPS
jgi:hypothetical protein